MFSKGFLFCSVITILLAVAIFYGHINLGLIFERSVVTTETAWDQLVAIMMLGFTFIITVISYAKYWTDKVEIKKQEVHIRDLRGIDHADHLIRKGLVKDWVRGTRLGKTFGNPWIAASKM